MDCVDDDIWRWCCTRSGISNKPLWNSHIDRHQSWNVIWSGRGKCGRAALNPATSSVRNNHPTSLLSGGLSDSCVFYKWAGASVHSVAHLSIKSFWIRAPWSRFWFCCWPSMAWPWLNSAIRKWQKPPNPAEYYTGICSRNHSQECQFQWSVHSLKKKKMISDFWNLSSRLKVFGLKFNQFIRRLPLKTKMVAVFSVGDWRRINFDCASYAICHRLSICPTCLWTGTSASCRIACAWAGHLPAAWPSTRRRSSSSSHSKIPWVSTNLNSI